MNIQINTTAAPANIIRSKNTRSNYFPKIFEGTSNFTIYELF